MLKFFRSSILRSNRFQTSIPTSSLSSSFSDSALENSNICNEVVAFINTVHPISPALDEFVPFLNREVVVSALKHQVQLKKDPRICFRFFVWSAGIANFRSGVSQRLIVDMLLSVDNPNSFDLYWSVLDEYRSEKLPVPADAFAVLILGYWRSGNADMAVETFGRMNDYECKPNLAVYNVILNVLVKKGVLMLALAIYNKLMKSNWELGCDTYNTLIDGLCKNGRTEDALNLFDEMTEEGVLPSTITYTIIISGLCRAKRTDDAYRLFTLMKNNGCNPDAAVYNALLDGFSKCGQIDDAIMHLNSFVTEGYKIGNWGYSSLINGLIRVNRISEAEELIKKVFDAGLVPDVVLYTDLLHSLCESGKLQEATKMLQDMIARGVTPDTRCYNVLIKGFCDAGLLDNAQSLKLEISRNNQFPDCYTYTILICGLCRNGLSGEAQQIFNDMEKLGCSPSVVAFNALIDGLCKTGKLEEAHLMRYKMEIGKNPSLFLRLSQGSDRISDSASLQKMVENLVESGAVPKAYKLLMQLADSGVVPDITTYNCLINGFCKAGQIESALKLFQELQLRGHAPDSVTYGTLIDGLQRLNRGADAFKLFGQMKENRLKPSLSVYQMLMTWSCRKGKTSVAFDLWLECLRSLADREALKSAEESLQNGDVVGAVRSLLELDVELPGFDTSPYSIWLIGLCQVDRVEEALKTFSLLEGFSVVVSAPGCVALIRALCAKGNVDKAVDIFLYSMEKGYQLMPGICNTLLQHLLNSKGNRTVAFKLLDRMKSAGFDLKSHLFRRTKSLLDYSLLYKQNG